MSEKHVDKKDLKLFEEFYKEIPDKVHQLHVHERDGSVLMMSTIEDALRSFKHYKVFNFFDREDGIMDVFVGR